MKLKYGVKVILISAVFFSAVGFAGMRAGGEYKNVVVKFKDITEGQSAFIDESDIKEAVSEVRRNSPEGKLTESSLRQIEKTVRAYKFVADCQVSRDLRGNLVVEVAQNMPLARILPSADAAKGGYVSADGKVQPLSPRFTARCVLIGGAGAGKAMKIAYWKKPEGRQMLAFLKKIEANPFWKTQIVQINIDKKDELELYTLMGNQQILFGSLEDSDKKLEKLRLFYDKIVPAKGWNTYKTVNLKFDDQIVCK